MVVQCPEVLDCVECDDGSLVFLPRAIFVVFEEPERPGILQNMISRISSIDSDSFWKFGSLLPVGDV